MASISTTKSLENGPALQRWRLITLAVLVMLVSTAISSALFRSAWAAVDVVGFESIDGTANTYTLSGDICSDGDDNMFFLSLHGLGFKQDILQNR